MLLNIIDYITGMIASLYKGNKLSSKKSIKGIYKKIGHWLLVLTGLVIDICLLNYLKIEIPFGFSIGSAVAIWLSINEIISILENYCAVNNGKLPDFLKRFIDENKGEQSKNDIR